MARRQTRRQEPPAARADLKDRQAAILEAVVARYIGTAQPVGSNHVAESTELHLSTATIRAELANLESEGYLVQPHTSAGRIPTDKGYRFFVDHLAAPGVADAVQRRKVQRFFDDVHGELEEVLERSSNLLADLTSYAAVVVAPGHVTATIASAQLVALSPSSVLVLVVAADGTVERSTVDLGHPVDDQTVALASRYLDEQLRGRPLSDDSAVPPPADPAAAALLDQVSGALAQLRAGSSGDQVYVGGPSKLAGAFDAVETVRSVLGILEQQLVVVSLLREVLGRGLSVAIGQEHGYEELASCAVVVAPLSVDGQPAGAVGLLGPTRMHYRSALGAAQEVGNQLSERLSAQSGESGRG